MAELKETCSCGAELDLAGSDYFVSTTAAFWRRDHEKCRKDEKRGRPTKGTAPETPLAREGLRTDE